MKRHDYPAFEVKRTEPLNVVEGQKQMLAVDHPHWTDAVVTVFGALISVPSAEG